MVQSLNTKVDLTIDATSFLGINEYGKIMIGDNAFEFYNDRDKRKFIQIPWEDVDYVIASVLFKGRWIPRYAIRTKKNGTYTFSSKEPKKVLRAIREYVDPDHMVHSLGFFDILKRTITRRK
ncbi:DUF956 family protein [Enterococcus casseliflavus]|uniref:DUF956 family protein n=1 Tax=Enterococcus sp. 8E11_MSG4843 TaxID=1834190 RepID=UPI000B3E580D|nr:DUF956 family protein [Enterococcus sp. 8E11_MSG4843]MBO1097153.1 DUF956 family protein [Enterococcus casseliflavus]MBO1144278.1 DUF956 family protein [Enterococcus casseliflavus]OUZ35968.1 hypothetical protein A5885_000153 [Enterococcus sp. 8E11_MSG4843]